MKSNPGSRRHSVSKDSEKAEELHNDCVKLSVMFKMAASHFLTQKQTPLVRHHTGFFFFPDPEIIVHSGLSASY